MVTYTGIFLLLLVVLAFAGLGAAVVGIGRGNVPLTRAVVWVGLILAALIAVGTIIELTGLLFANQANVTVPLEPFTPSPATGIHLEGMTATILGGGVDSATLALSGLSWTPRVLLALGALLRGTTLIAVCLLAVRLARSLRDGDVFSSGTKAILVVAAIVGVAGFFGSILGDLGAWLAGIDALEWHGGSYDGPYAGDNGLPIPENLAQYGWPQPALRVGLPIWPLTASLGLALIGAIFKAGARLRRDTEGLV